MYSSVFGVGYVEAGLAPAVICVPLWWYVGWLTTTILAGKEMTCPVYRCMSFLICFLFPYHPYDGV